MIEIKNRWTGEEVYLVLASTLRGADLSNLDLRAADLRGADLTGADLACTDLHEADLSGATLPDGTRYEARRDLSKRLLDAGGHPVPDAAWSIDNVGMCPVNHAWKVGDFGDLPEEWQLTAWTFAALFDSGHDMKPRSAEEGGEG